MNTPERSKALRQDDAEEAVLSACLMAPSDAMPRVVGKLSPNSFGSESNSAIFGALLALYEGGGTIDPFTVIHKLEADGKLIVAGGKDRIGFILDSLPTAEHVQDHAAIVLDAARRREVVKLATELANSVGTATIDVDKAVQTVFSKLLPYAMKDGDTGYRRLDTYSTLEQIQERGKNPASILKVGYRCIDDTFHGFRPGELVIVGGAAKSGKTMLTINMARHVAERGHAVGFQSCEMSRDALTERLLNAVAQVHVMATGRGDVSNEEWERLAKAGSYLQRLPFEIDDTAMPTIDEVAAKVMALKARIPDLKMVVVDFLQLVTADLHGRTEAATLTYVSYRLKALAKTANIVLVAPVQLNYKQIDGEKREPELRDLQGSSGMAQAADAVFLCWRDAATADQYLRIKCAASRRTPTFHSQLVWNGRLMRVDDVERVDPSTGEVLS